MALTTKEIYDLDNSMVAAQNVELGTVLNALISSSGSTGALKVVSGTVSPSSPSTIVASGLSVIDNVVASLEGTPTRYHTWTSACIAGTDIVVTCWSGSAALTGVVSPIASSGSASAHFAKVYWMAQGTA